MGIDLTDNGQTYLDEKKSIPELTCYIKFKTAPTENLYLIACFCYLEKIELKKSDEKLRQVTINFAL